MLEINGLNAAYGKLHVLHDVSLTVREGERVGIFGHNGAGKTTLMRACVGDLRDVQGDIRYRGDAIAPNEAHRNVGLGIGFVQQGDNVFRELSVAENLEIAGLRHGQTGRDEVFGLFPLLAERSTQIAGSLSGG